jgi:hypothetical protein
MNLHRRHLDESQRAMVAARVATMRQGARTDPASIEAMSDAQAAKLLNVSEASVERAKAVRRDAVPEIIELVDDGDLAVSAAAAVAKATPERQKRVATKVKAGKRVQEAIKEVKKEDASGNAPALPPDHHRTIVIDPPWPMEKVLREVRPNQIDFDYATMIDEIKALKEKLPAAEDCHLFMWTTQKFLRLPLRFHDGLVQAGRVPAGAAAAIQLRVRPVRPPRHARVHRHQGFLLLLQRAAPRAFAQARRVLRRRPPSDRRAARRHVQPRAARRLRPVGQ